MEVRVNDMAGINKTLYEQEKTRKLLSQEQLMQYLNIDNARSLKRFIIKEKIPYINVNGKYMVQIYEYDKWIQRAKIIL